MLYRHCCIAAALTLATWSAHAQSIDVHIYHELPAIQLAPPMTDAEWQEYHRVQRQRQLQVQQETEADFDAFQKRSNAKFNCQINSWHPENCE